MLQDNQKIVRSKEDERRLNKEIFEEIKRLLRLRQGKNLIGSCLVIFSVIFLRVKYHLNGAACYSSIKDSALLMDFLTSKASFLVSRSVCFGTASVTTLT